MTPPGKPFPVASSKLWRKGKLLVARAESSFPDRCYKCNGPANGLRFKRVIYWQPPVAGYGGGAVIAKLIQGIWMAIGQRKVRLQIGVCHAHVVRRWQAIIIGWLGTIGGFVVMVKGFMSGWMFLTGIALFAGFAIFGAVKGRAVAAEMTRDGYVFIRGAGKEFVAELPEWPQR